MQYPDGHALHLHSMAVAAGDQSPWANPNLASAMLEASCPSGVETVGVEVELTPGKGASFLEGHRTENIYGLPLSAGASKDRIWLIKENTKQKNLAPLMLPCSETQIVYNSQRGFALGSDGSLTGFNSSASVEAPGRRLCLSADERGNVTTVLCRGEAEAEQWLLEGGRVVNRGDRATCLSVLATHSTKCEVCTASLYCHALLTPTPSTVFHLVPTIDCSTPSLPSSSSAYRLLSCCPCWFRWRGGTEQHLSLWCG